MAGGAWLWGVTGGAWMGHGRRRTTLGLAPPLDAAACPPSLFLSSRPSAPFPFPFPASFPAFFSSLFPPSRPSAPFPSFSFFPLFPPFPLPSRVPFLFLSHVHWRLRFLWSFAASPWAYLAGSTGSRCMCHCVAAGWLQPDRFLFEVETNGALDAVLPSLSHTRTPALSRTNEHLPSLSSAHNGALDAVCPLSHTLACTCSGGEERKGRRRALVETDGREERGRGRRGGVHRKEQGCCVLMEKRGGAAVRTSPALNHALTLPSPSLNAFRSPSPDGEARGGLSALPSPSPHPSSQRQVRVGERSSSNLMVMVGRAQSGSR